MEWAVVLAGGSGTRFWPLSSPRRPKQLLPLAGSRSTAETTMERLGGVIPPERTLLVTGAALAQILGERLALPRENLLVEPRAASTAPALAWATAEAARRDPDASVLALHSDWAIGEGEAFAASARTALAAARTHDRLVTVGIVPTRPETGYGYIVPGTPLGGEARDVARFTEKPDAATAATLVAAGALWNSGLFAWTARRLRAELQAHTPEVAPHLDALDRGDTAGFFAGVTPVSIDVGVLERSHAVAVVPGRFSWDDVGTWESLRRVRGHDAAGNVLVGRVVAVDAQGCIVWSEGTPIVVSGVSDLVVVEANGRILVLHRDRAADLKRTLDAVPPEIRELPE